MKIEDELRDAGEELVEKMIEFAGLLRRAGARDSGTNVIAHFSAYHLADLEGASQGGWLGGPFLRDALENANLSGWVDPVEDVEELERLDAMERRARVE